jgi:diguanylate cyclase (GGDEF)-like protein/PAS domain S-box-containing protein
MIYHHGVWFWVIVAYINALIFFSVFLFFRFILQTRELYRRQNIALIIAILFPWVGMLVYAFGANPFPGLDVLPISFTVTGVILVYITSYLNFLDIIPIAREYLVDTMLDGLMVIDKYNRIVDINPSAMRIFGDGSAHKWIGISAREALQNYTRLEQHLDATQQTQIEWEQTAPHHRHFDVQIFPLHDRKGMVSGKSVILRDVTHHKKIEKELQQTNDQLKEKLAQIEKLKDKLRDQSIRDALTGLFNRRYLDEIFDLEFARAEQENYPLCLLILDIDHFKEFNDIRGHTHGDSLLRKLGTALGKHFRMSDIPCRYGGDEFIIIMTHSISESAFQRIEDFRQICKTLSLEQPQGVPPVTFSAGIAAYPEHEQTAEGLFRLADQTLYRAKEMGRNRTCLP